MEGEKNQLATLRAALRNEPEAPSVDVAAAPFIERHFQDLLRFADRLVQGSRWRLTLDGADLAADAWLTALQRLSADANEALTQEQHFRQLLFRIVRTRFLDALEKEQRRDDAELDAGYAVREVGRESPGEALKETLPGGDSAEGNLFFGEGGRFLPLVTALFQGEEALRPLVARPPRRRVKHYQAMVLVYLGEFFRSEIGSGYGEQAVLFRRYLQLLEIPETLWSAVEDEALNGEDLSGILEVVNRQCETSIKDRATLSVLRYEFNQLVG